MTTTTDQPIGRTRQTESVALMACLAQYFDDPAATIGGYTIRSKLGSGGMSDVYRAHDPKLDREIALKVLNCEHAEQRRRILREGQALARVEHRNIITIYHSGVMDDGSPFLAMPLLRGTTLREWLQESKRSASEVLKLLIPVLDGLAEVHAHKEPLIHRDIKPENIMVDQNRVARLIDFGLVTTTATYSLGKTLRDGEPVAETLTDVAGTPRYMSPEQIRGDQLTPASDLFSFCVLLYEAVFGSHPFPGTTRFALHEAVLSRDPCEPKTRSWLERKLWRLIRRGLAKHPKDRYRNAGKLRDELQHLLVRRRRILATTGGFASMVALVAVGFALRPDPFAQRVNACLQAGDAPQTHLHESVPKFASTRLREKVKSYATSWREGWDSACKDLPAVEPKVARERKRCYERRAALVSSSLVDFGEATADERASFGESLLAAPFPALDECSNVDRLARRRLPTNPAQRDAIAKVHDAIEEAQSESLIGRHQHAMRSAIEAFELAQTISSRGARADAGYLLGHLKRLSYEIDPKATAQLLVASADDARAVLDFEAEIRSLQEAARTSILLAEDLPEARRSAARAAASLEPFIESSSDEIQGLRAAQHDVDGLLAHAAGDYIGAEAHFSAALEQARHLDARAFATRAQIAATLLNRGRTRSMLERRLEAIADTHASLAIERELYGRDHRATYDAHFNLAVDARAYGRLELADSEALKALLIAETEGPQGRLYGEAATLLAAIRLGRLRGASALNFARRARTVLLETGPRDMAITAWRIAAAARQLEGDPDGWREELEKLLAVLDPETESPDVALVLADLARAALDLGRGKEALEYLDKADRIHTPLPENVALRGRILTLTGHPAQAIPILEEALAKLDEGSEEAAPSRRALAEALTAEGRTKSRACSLMEEAQLIYKAMNSPGGNREFAATETWINQHCENQQ